MKVVVMGATGGSGRAAVRRLLDEGHEVTAFARRASGIQMRSSRLRFLDGDAMNPVDVGRAIQGQDAVVVTLGISENPVRVRVLGPARTPPDVRSIGTRHTIAAMQRYGVERLVVQTSYGVGGTRDRLRFVDRLFFEVLLKPQIVDTEIQNTLVSQSGLAWTLVQPVHLTDAAEDPLPYYASDGTTGRMSVSRGSVGRLLALAVRSPEWIGQTISVSGRCAETPEANHRARVSSVSDAL